MGAVGGHPALCQGHLNQEMPQIPALASIRAPLSWSLLCSGLSGWDLLQPLLGLEMV